MAELGAAVTYGKEERSGEGGYQLLEMAAAELGLALRPDRKHSGIFNEDARGEHVRDDFILRRPIEALQELVQPPSPVTASDPALLKRQRHHLLREDVGRQRRRADRLHEAVTP